MELPTQRAQRHIKVLEKALNRALPESTRKAYVESLTRSAVASLNQLREAYNLDLYSPPRV
jgi:uncharacterized protein (UPF0305 family)